MEIDKVERVVVDWNIFMFPFWNMSDIIKQLIMVSLLFEDPVFISPLKNQTHFFRVHTRIAKP